jgi:3-methyl-2-oxobutanoate hydroxymethyltransferase
MSTHPASSASGGFDRKVTIPGLKARKLADEKIVALTAYDYPSGLLCENAGMDVVLVGDSLGNTARGYENTLAVTVDEMHAALVAVKRAVTRPLLVVDLPFGSYHISDDEALRHATRLIKSGAEAVKLEGGQRRASLVRRLTDSEIPVMGHIGLTPQSIHALGGYRVQGKAPEDAEKLRVAALALEEAGAFSVVLEGIPAPLAATITAQLEIPTIGIGAGSSTDGQILVLADLIGLLPGKKPKFVRQYLDVHALGLEALAHYGQDVRAGTFPAPHESYGAVPVVSDQRHGTRD